MNEIVSRCLQLARTAGSIMRSPSCFRLGGTAAGHFTRPNSDVLLKTSMDALRWRIILPRVEIPTVGAVCGQESCRESVAGAARPSADGTRDAAPSPQNMPPQSEIRTPKRPFLFLLQTLPYAIDLIAFSVEFVAQERLFFL